MDRAGGGAVAPPPRQVVPRAGGLRTAPGPPDTEVEGAACEGAALEGEGKHALLVNILSGHSQAGLLLLLLTRAGGGGDGCGVAWRYEDAQLLNDLI